MLYRRLGRTNLQVSQLGFGAMRLPMLGEGPDAKVNRDLAIPMIHRAFELGVNYIDSAIMYCNHDSQAAVGEALDAWSGGERVIVSTKNSYFDDSETIWWTNLENSLRRLRVKALDIYHMHGINWKLYTEKVAPRVLKWMEKAKDQGLIRHICFSFHDDNEALVKLIDEGFADVVTLQYNMFNRDLETGIAHAHARDMGVVVMGPVAGGALGENSEVLLGMLPEVQRVPDLALRFVLANPHVSLALSGMSEMRHVEENTATASDMVSLTAEDFAVIDRQLDRLKKMADLYCTGCAYCKPCPNEIDIPQIFRLYNRARVYGYFDRTKNIYEGLPKALWGRSPYASECTGCGVCEPKCPQRIPIRKQLAEVDKYFRG